jgi:hypothetical protein
MSYTDSGDGMGREVQAHAPQGIVPIPGARATKEGPESWRTGIVATAATS